MKRYGLGGLLLGVSMALLVYGYLYFHRRQPTFSDVL